MITAPHANEQLIDHHSLLLEKISSKQLTLGVIGLGYVGLPLSLTFLNSGIKVIGCDSEEEKIALLWEGKNPLSKENHAQVEMAISQEMFLPTSDLPLISECDAVILCLPTPLRSNLEPDLSFIEDVCEKIAPYLKENALVSLESTTWPGTTEEVVKPLLEKGSSLQVGKNLFLVYSPERQDPGNQFFTTKTIPKLIAGIDQKSLELGIALYSLAIDTVVPMSSLKVAESTKLYENIFRSVNIALVNELKIVFQKMGIDIWEVIDGASTKPFGFMPFEPGPGLGGHCIPVDPFYLSWKAKEFGVEARFIELAGEINRSMPDYVVERVEAELHDRGLPLEGSRILLLGLAYKANVSDLRGAPALRIMELLEKKGASVEYHDPHIEKMDLIKEYPQFNGKKSQPLSKNYDLFLLITNHTLFNSEDILSCGVPIVDTRNCIPREKHVTQA